MKTNFSSALAFSKASSRVMSKNTVPCSFTTSIVSSTTGAGSRVLGFVLPHAHMVMSAMNEPTNSLIVLILLKFSKFPAVKVQIDFKTTKKVLLFCGFFLVLCAVVIEKRSFLMYNKINKQARRLSD